MKRWLLIPVCLVGGLLLGRAAVAYLEPVARHLADLSKYQSTCIIRCHEVTVGADRPEDAEKPSQATAVRVREEMLRYDRVMMALARTELMAKIRERVEKEPALRGRLEEALYRKIRRDTRITPRGSLYVLVSYLGSTPNEAHQVLEVLSTSFVENALRRERDTARQARDMVLKELVEAAGKLKSLEGRLAALLHDHPEMKRSARSMSDELGDVCARLRKLDREIGLKRRKLDRLAERLEPTPKMIVTRVRDPRKILEADRVREELALLKLHRAICLKTLKPDDPSVEELNTRIKVFEARLAEAGKPEREIKTPNPLREKLEEERLNLEVEVEALIEKRRTSVLSKARLEEYLKIRPALDKEMGRLRREREATLQIYTETEKQFKRVDVEFRIKMEGLVGYSIVSPARIPTGTLGAGDKPDED